MSSLTSLLRTEGSGASEVRIPISSLPPESRGAYFTVYSLWEGVVLIIDVVRANKFLQDEIGMRTSPDPSVCRKLVRDSMPD